MDVDLFHVLQHCVDGLSLLLKRVLKREVVKFVSEHNEVSLYKYNDFIIPTGFYDEILETDNKIEPQKLLGILAKYGDFYKPLRNNIKFKDFKP